MIRIDFNQFWKQVTEERKLKHLAVHRLERAETIWYFYLSSYGCEYCTRIYMQEIYNRAEELEMDIDDVLVQFYNVYSSDTILVEDVDWLDNFEEDINYNQVTEEVVEYIESKLNKSDIIDPGEDVIEEADDYADFFLKNVELWKRKVVKKIESSEFTKSYINKTFGDFVRVTMNVINARPFLNVVRRFVKKSMVEGLQSAEEELNMDIGISSSFEDKLMVLENQQLNGYTINGKMWYGIKGATKEMQTRIFRQISEDVQNKVPRDQMVKHIEKIFDGVATAQAMRIARTETTRFINEGKLNGYKESGMNGNKAWAVVPKKCCDICDRLHNKYFKKGIDLDKMFIDPITHKAYNAPPAHPHCRCVIEFRQKQ